MTENTLPKNRAVVINQNLPVLILFALVLIAGSITFKRYGESWDENLLQIYAEQSIKSYSTWFDKAEVEFEHENLRHYGPLLCDVRLWHFKILRRFHPPSRR